MGIITLTTDLGLKDHYVGSLKGSIYTQIPEARVVDISHEVPPYDLSHAAFLIQNSYKDFPKGTIHIIGVINEGSEKSPFLAIEYDGHYFIGADSGIFSLIFDQKPTKIIELKIRQDTPHLTFPARDIFVTAACHIARGGTLEIIGSPIKYLKEKTMFRPVIENNLIKGSVIHIDSYGNIFTNITKRLFREVGISRPFTIFLKREEYNITVISENYNQVEEGEKLALFSTADFLEIAINKGRANKLLGINLNDTIRIEFIKTIGRNDN